MSSGTHWICHPARGLDGTVRPPGDKSISHRVAMLAAMAGGQSRIRGFLESADCRATLAALRQLGAEVERTDGELWIRGMAGKPETPRTPLDCGNSGTAMRLLAGLLSGFPLSCVLTGDASLCRRPMRRILDPLERMGASVAALGENGCAPLEIRGGNVRGIEYALPVASAQIKSCLLLAGLCAEGTTRVIEPAPSRDHTERLFQFLGLPLTVGADGIRLHGAGGAPAIPPARYSIPGDFSSGAFWMVAAACVAGTRLRIESVGVNPRRAVLLDVLSRMGADVFRERVCMVSGEPCADVIVEGDALRATEISGAEIPGLIDELPVLCAAAACAQGVTCIRDAAELRVKESDRIAAMAAMLAAFGVRCETHDDGMDIYGGKRIRVQGAVDSFGDHRVAMSAAILALRADAPVRIDNVDCVSTSYPEFMDDWNRIRRPGQRLGEES